MIKIYWDFFSFVTIVITRSKIRFLIFTRWFSWVSRIESGLNCKKTFVQEIWHTIVHKFYSRGVQNQLRFISESVKYRTWAVRHKINRYAIRLIILYAFLPRQKIYKRCKSCRERLFFSQHPVREWRLRVDERSIDPKNDEWKERLVTST